MKSTIIRGAITAALLGGTSFGALAAPIGEHVNGFYQPEAGGTRRGLGVQYIPTGNDQGVLFVAYYAYDDANGEPIWISGATPATPDQSTVEFELRFVSGGLWGGPAGTPTNGPVIGTGTFTFNSCEDVQWSYSGDEFADFSDTMNNVVAAVTPNSPASCSVYNTPFEGCPSFATAGVDAGTCIIPGAEYTTDITLTNNTIWVLGGPVYIGSRSNAANTNSITIEPGTRIIGGANNALLGIQRGAKIFANGAPNAPIVFTGADGEAGGSGQWGGLTINGLAPLNTCATAGQCTSEGEGESGTYGGDDPMDSSGSLRFVRVQYAGQRFRDTNELNGIAFQGVGAGTVVENIQVHANEDDGVEFFGGTVNARNVVLTDIRDDSLDWTEGWTGSIQNLLVIQNQNFNAVDVADRGIEADNLEGNNNAEPRSQPKIANATFIGRPDRTGATLRRGTGTNLTNVIFNNFENCLDIDDSATFEAAGTPPNDLTGVLTIQNSIVNCTVNFVEEPGDPWTVSSWFDAAGTNMEMNPNLQNLVFPPANATYTSGFSPDPELFPTGFFQNLDYIGAFGQGPAWTAGWTLQNYNN